jgi:zinc transporter ZupT
MPEQSIAALVAAVGLAAIHLFAGKLVFLEGVPRSRWLSVAGGISVAYVFVHLLPELSAAQEAVEDPATEVLGFLEEHVYILALAGLALFYGVESASRRSRRQRRAEGGEDRTGAAAFALSIASFAAYNAIIGYLLLHREEPGLSSLAFFALALGVHFVVTDFGLREHHKRVYHSVGRWVLAASVLVGYGVGLSTEISEAAIGLLMAFLGGGIILNVVKEELPEERSSRFGAFVAGALGYTLLLQLT